MESMIGLLQRVTEASVTVEGERVAAIGRGLVVLVGVEAGDTEAGARRLAERLLGYRIFPDDTARMNASVAAVDGDVLLVPQFTLAADTRKGMRPSFTPAAEPATGAALFESIVVELRRDGRVGVATGRFGADMQLALVNDGPVTFELRVPPAS
jgi:D-tyrosyl-tRNA(Tyr) deacylase